MTPSRNVSVIAFTDETDVESAIPTITLEKRLKAPTMDEFTL